MSRKREKTTPAITEHDGSLDNAKIAEQLDELILAYFTAINEAVAKHAKLGDLIKMIELKQKLLPDNSEQKQFWKMMQDIRKEKLPGKRTPTGNDFQSPRRKRAKQ